MTHSLKYVCSHYTTYHSDTQHRIHQKRGNCIPIQDGELAKPLQKKADYFRSLPEWPIFLKIRTSNDYQNIPSVTGSRFVSFRFFLL